LPGGGNFETIGAMETFAANRRLPVATIWLAAALLPLAAVAQDVVPTDPPPQLFVSDKLVLNVYAEPDQSSARVATIQTGDAVDELERAGNSIRVRLEDGREGWVGANYLTTDVPAATRLRELQRQQPTARGPDKESAAENARLKNENIALRARVDELQSRVAKPITPVVAEVVQDKIELASTVPTGGVPLSWLLLLVPLTGALGFAGGYRALALRLRRKFGALKIY
jgi:hypothetical protein